MFDAISMSSEGSSATYELAALLATVAASTMARMRAYLDFAASHPRLYEAMFSMPSGLAAARLRGIAVPTELQIFAGNDSPAARSSDPPLTALDNRARLLGQKAVELLISQVEDRSIGHSQIVVPAILRERGSTRADGRG